MSGENEIVNDLDSELINFWLIVRDRGDELIRAFRERMAEGYDIKEEVAKFRITDDTMDAMERAVRYLIVNKSVVFGDMNKLAARSVTLDVEYIVNKIRENSIRLRGVTIRNDDYLKVCREFDGSETFVFLDPPYREFEDYRIGGFSDGDYEKMAEYMRNTKSRVLLTINADDKVIERIFGEFGKKRVTEGKLSGSRMGEMMYVNFDVTGFDYR